MRNRYYLLLGLLAGLASCTKSDQGPATTAAFTLSRSVIELGEQVQVTNTSQNAASYRWSAGGMQDSVQVVANPTFKARDVPGTYNVKLTATNTNERRASAVVPIRIGRRTLKTLRLTVVPATRPNGQPWHADGTGLNLSCVINSGSTFGVIVGRSNIYPNVQPANLPVDLAVGGGFYNGVMLITLLDNVGGVQEDIVSIPLTITGPPANRDEAGNGSYTTQYNGWGVVAEIETR